MLSRMLPKKQRASHACDFCHARGLRCRWAPGGADPTQQTLQRGCLTCKDYEIECTNNRPVLKRGRKPRTPQTKDVEVPRIRMPIATPSYMSLDVIWRLLRIYRDTMYQC